MLVAQKFRQTSKNVQNLEFLLKNAFISEAQMYISNVGIMYSMTASMDAALLQTFVLRNRSNRKLALWRHLLSINQVTNTLLILMLCIMPISSDCSFHDISQFQSQVQRPQKEASQACS